MKNSTPHKNRPKSEKEEKQFPIDLWQPIIFSLYQIGITLYYIGYWLCFQIGKKYLKIPLPDKTRWNFSLPHPSAQRSQKPNLVWIHAVSGGEVKLAERVILNYFPRKKYSGKILISYCSKTGWLLAEDLKKRYPHLITSYLPIDFHPLTRRSLSRIRDNFHLKKIIVIEHDFWPNWLSGVKEIGGKRMGINYFLKTRDYVRYLFLPPAYHFVHDIDVLLTQNQEVTRQVMDFKPRFKVITAGNMKYSPSPTPIKKKPPTAWKGITVTLGSSHPGEEDIVIQALKKYLVPQGKLRLIIIPRHPERANNVGKLSEQWGLTPHIFPQKTSGNLLVVNEMGWSESLYRASDIVIIGDTFLPSPGGHNFLEAMSLGRCVVYGPYMVNYADITAQLEKEEAVIRINPNPPGGVQKSLEETLDNLIKDRKKRMAMGRAGKESFKNIQYDHKIYQRYLSIHSTGK